MLLLRLGTLTAVNEARTCLLDGDTPSPQTILSLTYGLT